MSEVLRSENASSEQPIFITEFDEATIAGFDVGSGPLDGVRFAVKDNLDVAGVPTTAGFPDLTTPAAAHATAVSRLLSAGAVPIGKTNLDQFATGLVGTRSPYGACHSVASKEHVSGGSSSGSAVAVAAGLVPLALGTDTAGSGRVPAAFNGIVGMKPTRGLVSTRGLFPACRSLDCITTFTRTAALARQAFEVLAGFDAADPYSRPMPAAPPLGIARELRVIAVPDAPLDLDPFHAATWERAVKHAQEVGIVVEVDVTAFLEAARLLYEGPFLAERGLAFGSHLASGSANLDPTVRAVVEGAARLSAEDAFAGMHRLAELRARAMAIFTSVDALLLPVTPTHPRLDEVAADPIGVNSRLGTYTNMTNLLDLCAIAVPAGQRDDGLPFGVQLLAPAFADRQLLDLASRWLGEPSTPASPPAGRHLLAVAGAHLHGQPRNADLLDAGGRLSFRARTSSGYRMYSVPGPFPRPGLIRGDGPAEGLEVEVWDVPGAGLGALLDTIAPPLALGRVTLSDGATVIGFVATSTADAVDITSHRSWRNYLAVSAASGSS